MAGIEDFRYDGKRALVVGGATGMGAAAAAAVTALGGEVVVMDRAAVDHPVAEAVKVDLQDRADLDAALDQVGGPFDALFSAAGVADGPALMRINVIAHRHLIDRLVSDGRLGRGTAICPGPMDTPPARANADLWLAPGEDYRQATGTAHHTPRQTGDTMALLNSGAASGISGVTLLVDAGYVGSSSSGSFGPGKAIVDLLSGRS